MDDEQQPDGGDHLGQPQRARRPRRRRPLDGRELEHQVGDDGAEAAADDLGDDVQAGVAAADRAVGPVDEGDDRVEVAAGDRPEDQDQPDQRAGGGGGVLEQLQPDVARREPAGHDPRTDDRDDQQAGAERLGDQAPGQLDRDLAGARLGELGRARSCRTRDGGDALAELGDGRVERLRRADRRPGRGSTSGASSGCGSSSSWARSHTVIVSGGPTTDRARARSASHRRGRGRRGGRRRARPGWTRSAGWVPALAAGAPVRRGPQTGGELGPGRVRRCTRTAPAVDRRSARASEVIERSVRPGGRSGVARRRWTGCARSDRPPRARRGGGPAGSTARRAAR